MKKLSWEDHDRAAEYWWKIILESCKAGTHMEVSIKLAEKVLEGFTNTFGEDLGVED